ncbi:MAG: T9SS type A sorting domain-containing protein [Crocinitomicaceae bacterium]|nr:T9SS type A sorting domain-containing protein [Crocinitomicaceae bacterium]
MTKYLKTIIFILFSQLAFSQTQNFWTKKSDFSGLKRERAVAFTIDDRAYVGTGVDTAEIVHKDFWEYDPVADTWSQIADIPGSVRRNAIAFSVQGFGYVGTGMDSVVATAPGSSVLNDFWQYDPTTNSWVQKADFPGGANSGVYFATSFSIDSKGYICGGKRGPNNYTNELWEYKPSTDSWAQLPNFPGGVRYQLSSFSIDFKGYVGLGTDQDIYRKDFWAFDVTTNQWNQISDIPASERSSAMTFSIGQRGYVCMGGNGGLLGDLWEYNPFNDSWSIRAAYGGSERKNGVGFTLNGKGYVGTGKGYSGKKASFHEYTPPAILTIEEADLDFSFYPNPTQNQLTLSYTSTQIKTIELYNLSGKQLFSAIRPDAINVSQIPKGVYYMIAKSTTNDIISTQKVIVQ